eukprot:jgi/Mesen1/10716/ME000090S10171
MQFLTSVNAREEGLGVHMGSNGLPRMDKSPELGLDERMQRILGAEQEKFKGHIDAAGPYFGMYGTFLPTKPSEQSSRGPQKSRHRLESLSNGLVGGGAGARQQNSIVEVIPGLGSMGLAAAAGKAKPGKTAAAAAVSVKGKDSSSRGPSSLKLKIKLPVAVPNGASGALPPQETSKSKSKGSRVEARQLDAPPSPSPSPSPHLICKIMSLPIRPSGGLISPLRDILPSPLPETPNPATKQTPPPPPTKAPPPEPTPPTSSHGKPRASANGLKVKQVRTVDKAGIAEVAARPGKSEKVSASSKVAEGQESAGGGNAAKESMAPSQAALVIKKKKTDKVQGDANGAHAKRKDDDAVRQKGSEEKKRKDISREDKPAGSGSGKQARAEEPIGVPGKKPRLEAPLVTSQEVPSVKAAKKSSSSSLGKAGKTAEVSMPAKKALPSKEGQTLKIPPPPPPPPLLSPTKKRSHRSHPLGPSSDGTRSSKEAATPSQSYDSKQAMSSKSSPRGSHQRADRPGCAADAAKGAESAVPNIHDWQSLLAPDVVETWAECDQCQTWRLVPPPPYPTDVWSCRQMEWLPHLAHCGVSEDDVTRAVYKLRGVEYIPPPDPNNPQLAPPPPPPPPPMEPALEPAGEPMLPRKLESKKQSKLGKSAEDGAHHVKPLAQQQQQQQQPKKEKKGLSHPTSSSQPQPQPQPQPEASSDQPPLRKKSKGTKRRKGDEAVETATPRLPPGAPKQAESSPSPAAAPAPAPAPAPAEPTSVALLVAKRKRLPDSTAGGEAIAAQKAPPPPLPHPPPPPNPPPAPPLSSATKAAGAKSSSL